MHFPSVVGGVGVSLMASSLRYRNVDWNLGRSCLPQDLYEVFSYRLPHNMVAGFQGPASQKRGPGGGCIAFYDLALEVMQYNFHHILFVRVSKTRPYSSEGNKSPPLDGKTVKEFADMF